MATIKDVAKLADVSISTVSNIINCKYNAKPEVYDRVLKAIEELNYNPSVFAKNLRKNKSNLVAIILPTLAGHYNQIFEGVNSILSRKNYNTIVKLTNGIKEVEKKVLEDIISQGVKGILLITCDNENVEMFESVVNKVPLVFLERNVKGKDYSYVKFDNEKIVYDLTMQLLESKAESSSKASSMACEDIVLITGKKELSSEEDCIKGFVSALKEKGKKPDNRVREVNLIKEHAFNSLLFYINSLEKVPRCFIVSDEEIANCLFEILSIFNHKSAIYTLSGNSWYEYCQTSIKKIKRDAINLGMEGAKLLLKCIDSPIVFENKQIIIPQEQNDFEDMPVVLKTAHKKDKIKLLLLDGPTADSLLALIPNFEQNYGINIEYEIYKYIDLYNKIKEEHALRSSEFDVFMIDLPWIKNMVEDEYLLRLDKHIESENDNFLINFEDNIRNIFILSNKDIFTVPLMIGVQMLLYRTDLFENQRIKWMFHNKYGIELNPPKTWTEFNLIAEFFTRKFNPQSPVEYGTCIVGLNPTGIVEEFLPRQWAYKGEIVSKNKKICINSIQNVKALKNLCDSYKYSPEESLNFWWDDQIKLFSKGDVALINTFNSHILRNYNLGFDDIISRAGYAAIPGNVPMIGGWSLGINRYSDCANESHCFIRWACSNKLSVHNTLLGGFLPKKKVCNNNQIKMTYSWFNSISSYIQNSRERERVVDAQGKTVDTYILETIIANGITDAITGKYEPEHVLNDLGKKLKELIKI